MYIIACRKSVYLFSMRVDSYAALIRRGDDKACTFFRCRVMAYAFHMRHVSESAATCFSDLLSCSSIISCRSVIVISLQKYLTTSTEPLLPYTNV